MNTCFPRSPETKTQPNIQPPKPKPFNLYIDIHPKNERTNENMLRITNKIPQSLLKSSPMPRYSSTLARNHSTYSVKLNATRATSSHSSGASTTSSVTICGSSGLSKSDKLNGSRSSLTEQPKRKRAYNYSASLL